MKNVKINLLSKSKVAIPLVLACCFQYSQASAQMANNVNYDFTKNWSFGINALYSKTGLKDGYGGNTFSTKPNLGINPFVRHMFNSDWGIEAGLDIYKNIKRISSYGENDTMTGIGLREIFRIARGGTLGPGLNTLIDRTNIKQRHIYLGGIRKIDISDKSGLNLMLGLSLSKLNARSEIFSTNVSELAIPDRKILNYSKTKLIPIVRASFEHQLNSNFKLQALAVWKWTSKLKVKSKEELKIGHNNSFGHAEIKPKDSIGLGLGVTYCI